MTIQIIKQPQQTYAERMEVCEQWAKTYQKNLAETDKNWLLLKNAIDTKHSKFLSVAILCQIVESLRDRLDWLQVPAPVRPDRRSLAQKLYEIGVFPSEHISHSDKLEEEKKTADMWRERRELVAIRKERAGLKEELSRATYLSVQHSSGRTDHYATQTEREKATASVLMKIKAFNERVPESERIVVKGKP
jgi:hypothetical protein